MLIGIALLILILGTIVIEKTNRPRNLSGIPVSVKDESKQERDSREKRYK
jgi:hypothetical protein